MLGERKESKHFSKFVKQPRYRIPWGISDWDRSITKGGGYTIC